VHKRTTQNPAQALLSSFLLVASVACVSPPGAPGGSPDGSESPADGGAPLPDGGQVALIFHSGWEEGPTGAATSAIRDNGKWHHGNLCSQPLISVVDVASIPGSSPPPAVGIRRALRLEASNNGHCSGVMAELQRQGLQRGQSWWWRYYYRLDSNSPRITHYETTCTFSYRNLTPMTPHIVAPGQNQPFLITEGNEDYPITWWHADRALPTNTWYRYETHVEILGTAETAPSRVGTNWALQWEHPGQVEFRIWPRIYAADGTLLLSAENFLTRDAPSPPNLSLSQFYALGRTHKTRQALVATNWTADAAEGLTKVGLGNNGATASNPPETDGSQYWYYAKFAVSAEGWIGPSAADRP
jgi:hypothetical protein